MKAMSSDNHKEHSIELTISNRLGLHARAAARLVAIAEQYEADVAMEKNGETADAKSILSLLALECPLGTKVVVRVSGADAKSALAAITELIENKFGEE